MLTLFLFHLPKMWFHQLFLDLLLLCFCASACTCRFGFTPWFMCERFMITAAFLLLCVTYRVNWAKSCVYLFVSGHLVLISNFFINASHIWTSFIVYFSSFAALLLLCICAHNSLITNDSGSVCLAK